MNVGPYRTSVSPSSPHDGGTVCLFSAQSVRALPSVSFIPMLGMEGQPCVDMHGDLPFGTFVLPDATLRGEAAYVFTSDGSPILEQNADFLRKKRFLKPRIGEEHRTLRSLREVDDLVSLISRCDTGFFHWMMDSLPKVVIAEACGFTGSYLVPAPSIAPWAEESLTLLGISPTRLIHHSALDTHARRLFIPTYFSGYNAHHNKPFMELYRDTVRRVIPIKPKRSHERILIARKPETKIRRIINHDEVRHAAEQFGFQTVYFEDLSFREQLQRALSAEAMLGAHGSGLCHSLFMDEGSTLIELFPFARKQSCDCYEMIATIPEHRYYALESEHECEGDLTVPTNALKGILMEALTS